MASGVLFIVEASYTTRSLMFVFWRGGIVGSMAVDAWLLACQAFQQQGGTTSSKT